MFRSPRKVPRIKAEGTELLVSTARAHSVDTLRAEPCVSGLATELELPLLAVVCALGTSCGALVS